MPTTLAAGDIAFSAYQSDNIGGSYNGDAFEFVLLVPVTAGTIIYFTDNGFRTDSNTFRTNEGLLRWTAQTDLPAGTIITYIGNSGSPTAVQPANTAEWTAINGATGAVITTSTFSLAAAGDSIHAFQNPVFGGTDLLGGTAIAAMSIGGPDGFEAVHTTTSSNAETGLATGLTDGVNAVSFIGRANARYDETAVGSIEVGTAAQIRASLNNDTLWLTLITPGGGTPSGVFNPGGHTAGTFQVVNVTPATVSINDVSVNEGNAGTTTMTFTVTRTNNTGAFTLNYATADGTATTAGSDYAATSGTITFTAGGSLTSTVTVTINGDTAFEANETFFVNLINISDAAAATFSDAQGLGTITNDDAAPNVAPVIDLNGAGAGTSTILAYTEGGVAAAIAPAGTVADANSTNFNGGSLTVALTANGTTADQLSIQNQGSGAGQIGVSGANVSFGGTAIGTFSGGTNGTALVITFNSASATPAAAQALEQAILYANSSNNPSTLARTLTFTLVDGGGTANGGSDTGTATATVNVTAVDNAPIAVADSGTTTETTAVAVDLLANDTDVDGGPKDYALINGVVVAIGASTTLASGATVTRNANGTVTYNPNGAYNYLISSATAAATGASNSSATDSFTYQLTPGSSSTTVTMTIQGVDGVGDELRGTPGVDFINGTAGNDIISLFDGDDRARGFGGNDTIFGGLGYDQIGGGDGDDILDGGTGVANELGGGPGNDTYVARALGDTITESLGEGTDLVQSYVNVLTLSANVENLTFLGAGNFVGVGNGLDNVITGGVGADSLSGGGGNDTLIGGSGAANELQGGAGDDIFVVSVAGDSIVETVGGGTDTVQTALGAYVLPTNVENLTYTGAGGFNGTGNALDNTITHTTGTAGELTGLGGNDTYVVTVAGDTIIEAAAGGTDTVQTTLTNYTLANNVENLTFTGGGVHNGVGNGSDNTIIGGTLADALSGLNGNDTLIGGNGADLLIGGAGNDTFRYLGGETGLDRILDFTSGSDKISLNAAFYTVTGTLAFVSGTSPFATTANSTFLYDSNTGILSYDADGNGAGAAVQIAQLNSGLPLSLGDFVIA